MTSSNGDISASLAFCVGNPSVLGGFPSRRPVTRNVGVFFDVRLNKRLNKQWSDRWFETPGRSLWRLYNGKLLVKNGFHWKRFTKAELCFSLLLVWTSSWTNSWLTVNLWCHVVSVTSLSGQSKSFDGLQSFSRCIFLVRNEILHAFPTNLSH